MKPASLVKKPYLQLLLELAVGRVPILHGVAGPVCPLLSKATFSLLLLHPPKQNNKQTTKTLAPFETYA